MYGVDQLLKRKSMGPRLVWAASGTDFADDHEIIRIGMKSLFNDLVGHIRAVKVAGIDMVHACRNRLPQNSNRSLNIARRSPYLRASKLHRAAAHPVPGEAGLGKLQATAKAGRIGQFVPIL